MFWSFRIPYCMIMDFVPEKNLKPAEFLQYFPLKKMSVFF